LVSELHERSRARRETQERLTVLREPPASHSRRNDLLPDLRIEYRPVDSLMPANRRVRKTDKVQAARIDRSIAQFGVCEPILINVEGRIVKGHGVWEAAKRAGLDRVPTIDVSYLSADEQRVLAITLNRLGETGQWDEEVLALEFAELIELDKDVIVTGFELAEIDALLLDDGCDDEDEDVLPELPAASVSLMGDLWQLGDHRLLHGDALVATSYQRLFLENELARLALTDVPFNVPNVGFTTSKAHHRDFVMAHGELSREEFFEFNQKWMEPAARVVVEGGLLATFIDWRSLELVLTVGRALGLTLLNIVVWRKSNGGQGSLWRSQHEFLPVFKSGTAPHVNNVQLGAFGRWRSNVWTYPGGSSLGSEARAQSDDHPTVKPRVMLEDALLDISNRGEIVLDPFLGSGSTLLAAETTQRVCRGIEIDGRYCDVAIERWQALTGSAATLAETGEAFAEVAARRARDGAEEVRE